MITFGYDNNGSFIEGTVGLAIGPIYGNGGVFSYTPSGGYSRTAINNKTNADLYGGIGAEGTIGFSVAGFGGSISPKAAYTVDVKLDENIPKGITGNPSASLNPTTGWGVGMMGTVGFQFGWSEGKNGTNQKNSKLFEPPKLPNGFFNDNNIDLE